jgi:hypothetical protein
MKKGIFGFASPQNLNSRLPLAFSPFLALILQRLPFMDEAFFSSLDPKLGKICIKIYIPQSSSLVSSLL